MKNKSLTKTPCLALIGIITAVSCISVVAANLPSVDFGPKSQTVYVGGGATFQILASGDSLSYVWEKDGAALANGDRISGANTDTLNIAKAEAGDAGAYSCIVSNASGVADSAKLNNATLTVNPLPDGLLYAEAFPSPWCKTNQDYPLNTVGWNPGNKPRIHNGTDSMCNPWLWQDRSGTYVYYVTTASDTGVSGLPFREINPASNPGLSLSADIGAGTNVTAYFAVQIGGNHWFVSATPLAIQNRDPYGMASCTQTFTPTATSWKSLTIDGENGTVGSPATADLAGSITGAGLVFVFAAEDSGSFGNFKISKGVQN